MPTEVTTWACNPLTHKILIPPFHQIPVHRFIVQSQWWNTFSIYRQGFINSTLPSVGTRPMPIDRLHNQPSSDRVVVHIRHFLVDITNGTQIAIVTTAALPETIVLLAVRLGIH